MENGDAIRDASDFIHAMAHVNNSNSFFLQAANVFKKLFGFGIGQRSGRFIEN
jgi:hypothetical protein